MKIRPFFYLFLMMSCSTPETHKQSDHYSIKNKVFSNPTSSEAKKGYIEFFKWKVFTTAEKWPTWVDLKNQPNLKAPTGPNQFNISFINHSSFLIQSENINILTDPVYSERVSPVSWAGPKRVHAPGVKFKDLPKIHVVLISHNHYDHMDAETLKRLNKEFSPIFICPLGDKKFLDNLGLKHVFELDWWQNLAFNDMEIFFTPTQHWSGRGLFDRFESLWGSFVLKLDKSKIYFAGDTGYSTHFKTINERFGAMDLSLLPIGAYAPRWFMQTMHMDPEEAIWAHKDLKSKNSIGMHFGSFQLTNEKREEPEQKLKILLKSNNVKDSEFKTLQPGQSQLFRF